MNPSKSHNQPRQAQGFTLVELLVVIVIIAVLAAIGTGAMFRFRNSGNKANAIRNIRQLHTANVSYAADHNGNYVPVSVTENGVERDWTENREFLYLLTSDERFVDEEIPDANLPPFPEGMLDPTVVSEKNSGYNLLGASFGYNSEGLPWDDEGDINYYSGANLSDPNRSALFFTATDWKVRYEGRFLWERLPVEGLTNDGKIAYRHGKRAVAVYYDGHVDTLTMGDIRTIDGKGGRDSVFWLAKPRINP